MPELVDLAIRAKRVAMGLNAALLANIIGASPEELRMLQGRAVPTAALLERVEVVYQEYLRYRKDALDYVKALKRVMPSQLSRQLHLSPQNLYQMIHRGEITPSATDHRNPDRLARSVEQYWFDYKTVKSLFDRNGKELEETNDLRRTGVFGRAFAQYVVDSQGIKKSA